MRKKYRDKIAELETRINGLSNVVHKRTQISVEFPVEYPDQNNKSVTETCYQNVPLKKIIKVLMDYLKIKMEIIPATDRTVIAKSQKEKE